jgi:hypothetical protein
MSGDERMTPELGFLHWEMVLVRDPEYRATWERIGAAVQRAENEDGKPAASPLDRLKHFRVAIAAGIYPDSHTLAFVQRAFAKYLDGARSLDEAFGLKSRQRVGNPAQHDTANEARNRRCYEMYVYLKTHPEESQAQAAEAVQRSLDETVDVETMVRNYATWKRWFERVAGRKLTRSRKKKRAKTRRQTRKSGK